MTESPRWERESHEDLSAPAPQPPDTVEMEALPAPDPSTAPARSAGRDPSAGRAHPSGSVRPAGSGRLVDPDELDDPPEFAPASELEPAGASAPPRLAGARDSLAATGQTALEQLTATRDAALEHLSGAREVAGRRLSAGLQATRERSFAGGESAGALLAIARRWLSSATDSAAVAARRLGRWVAALDRRPEFDAHISRDPVAELRTGDSSPDPSSGGDHDPEARFPITLRGYDRAAVDGRLAEIESELARLRARDDEPMSITEEIERLGEQTASILVVAHDKAHETQCRAQEQAARAVTEAADDAERITAEAQRRLRELDEETDAVWRERQRLLDDVRDVSSTLATLADAAVERFPPDADAGAATTTATTTATITRPRSEPQPAGASAPVIPE